MSFSLTEKQVEHNRLLGGRQRHTALVGGSRSGKTFLICRAVLTRAIRADYSRHGIFRLRGNAARASIWLDTLPKVARVCYPGLPLKDHRQDGYISLPNSSEIWIGGLDDKDRTEKILGQEYCVDPEALVLTADLRWLPAKDLFLGQELIGFDENLNGHTVLRRSVVENNETIIADRVRVRTTKGDTIVSVGHRFVTHSRTKANGSRLFNWFEAKDLKPGMRIRFAAHPWKVFQTYESGWLAGIYDGEGSVHSRAGVGIAQNRGVVLDKIRAELDNLGVQWRDNGHDGRKCVGLAIVTIWDCLKLLGATRPVRLLPKAAGIWEDRRGFNARKKVVGDVATVLEVEKLGPGPVIALGTSTKTFIADGFLGHNSSLYFNECSQIPYGSVQIALTRLAQSIPGLRQRAYYDLNPVGKGHWTHRVFVQKIDPSSRQPLADPDDYRHAFLNPMDNAANLSPEYLNSLRGMSERNRRRFYSGEYVDEIDGALWSLELLELARCSPEDVPKTLRRVIVAVDPSGTDGEDDGAGRHDEVGIVVVGLGDDGIAYVLADLTCQLGPEGWGRLAVAAYDRYAADAIVAETNFGGAMVRYVIQTAAGPRRSVPVYSVTASRGKAVRAEPVAALYGSIEDASSVDEAFVDQRQLRGKTLPQRVRHVWSDRPDGSGDFSRLEDELLQFSTFGYQGLNSPNRADALVWGLTHLMLQEHLAALAPPVLVSWRPPSPEHMPAPEQRAPPGSSQFITLDRSEYETITERRGW